MGACLNPLCSSAIVSSFTATGGNKQSPMLSAKSSTSETSFFWDTLCYWYYLLDEWKMSSYIASPRSGTIVMIRVWWWRGWWWWQQSSNIANHRHHCRVTAGGVRVISEWSTDGEETCSAVRQLLTKIQRTLFQSQQIANTYHLNYSHELTRIYFRVGRGSKLADWEPEKKRKKGRVRAKRAATTTEGNTDKEERAESWKQRSLQCERRQALWDGNLVPDERKTPRPQDAFTSDDPGTWRPLQFTRGLCRDSPHCQGLSWIVRDCQGLSGILRDC